MKKLITAALAIILSLTIVACGSKDSITSEEINKIAVEELDKNEEWEYAVSNSDENALEATVTMLSSRDIELKSLEAETVYPIIKNSTEMMVLTISEVTDEKEREAYEDFLKSENGDAYVCSKGNFIVMSTEESGDELSKVAKKLCE